MRCTGTSSGRSRFLVTALLALSVVLSACGGSAQPPAPATQPTAAPAPATQATAAPATQATAAPAQPTAAAAAPPTLAPIPAPAEGTFTYWGGLIFSDEANNMLAARITQWGQEQGIKVEVVMINQNETTQRVSAAVEAGTMPDALDLGRDLMLLLSQSGKLEALDDVYEQVGEAHGGWLEIGRLREQPPGLRRQALRRALRHQRQRPVPARRRAGRRPASPKRPKPGRSWARWR